jgi:hypothetical protein
MLKILLRFAWGCVVGFAIGCAILAFMGCAAAPLPHRTTGLDPQGHLVAGLNPHGPLCPTQHTYYNTDGFPLFCWGSK